MHQSEHAREIASRFKEIFEESGDTFSDDHYSELVLLIEAGLDTTVMEVLEKAANKLDKVMHSMRHTAEFLDEDEGSSD